MNELLTIKKYWKEWKDPRLIVLVLHNNDLNQVTWEMRAMAGDTRYAASQELPDFEYARFAELCGLRGIRVDRPERLAAAWDEALASPMPVVLEAIVDPDVPPLPPHITLDADAELRNEPAEGRARRGGPGEAGHRAHVPRRRQRRGEPMAELTNGPLIAPERLARPPTRAEREAVAARVPPVDTRGLGARGK